MVPLNARSLAATAAVGFDQGSVFDLLSHAAELTTHLANFHIYSLAWPVGDLHFWPADVCLTLSCLGLLDYAVNSYSLAARVQFVVQSKSNCK